MKLVIDIPEERYKDIQRIAEVQLERNHFQTAEQIIANGVPVDTRGDCISREAVIDRINKLIEVEKKQGTDDWGYGRERVNAYENMLHFVGSEYLLPSVEPERKTGKWIPVYDDNGRCSDFRCSACNGADEYGSKFCPNCGAKMEVDG